MLISTIRNDGTSVASRWISPGLTDSNASNTETAPSANSRANPSPRGPVSENRCSAGHIRAAAGTPVPSGPGTATGSRINCGCFGNSATAVGS